jgi:hypothetical protein
MHKDFLPRKHEINYVGCLKPGSSAQTLVPKRDGSGIPDFSSGFSTQPDRITPMEGYSTFPDHLPHIITFFFRKQFTSVSVSSVPPSLQVLTRASFRAFRSSLV